MFKQLSALAELFKENKPDMRLIRCAAILEVLYIFGNTYGLEFGLLWAKGIYVGFRFGVYNEEGYVTISNHREFCNLVETIEEVGTKGNLQGEEVFLCTDNMVSESIAAAGSFKSEVLLDLVMRLHCLSMHFRCNFRFIHVAGTRMIRQVTEGLSSGDIYEGIMMQKTMIYFLLL